mgnify:CR=1 FL=1
MASSKETHVVSTRVDDETYAEIETIAQDEDRTRAKVVAILIKNALAERAKPAPRRKR